MARFPGAGAGQDGLRACIRSFPVELDPSRALPRDFFLRSAEPAVHQAGVRCARATRVSSWVTMTKLVARRSLSESMRSNTAPAVRRRGCRWARLRARRRRCVTSARAIAARWRSPPESSPGAWSRRWPRPTSLQHLRSTLVRLGTRDAADVERHRDVLEAPRTPAAGDGTDTKPSEALRERPRAASGMVEKSCPINRTCPRWARRVRRAGASGALARADEPTIATRSPRRTSELDAVEHAHRLAPSRNCLDSPVQTTTGCARRYPGFHS